MTCYQCGKKGHIATNCPAKKPGKGDEDNEEGKQLHTMRAMESDESGDEAYGSEAEESNVDGDDDAVYFFHPRETKGLSWDWLLLDSQSSMDMFCNRSYLTKVKAATRPTTIHCNAGSTVCTKEGVFSTDEFGDIPVKYHPSGICNVISLKTMKALFPISYVSDPSNPEAATFQVKTKKGIIKFKPCSKGLHYYDLTTSTKREEMHVQTVQQNFEGFSREQVLRAIKARKLQAMLGSPTRADFEGMVCGKLIADCPVDVVDLKNAHTIFGPDLAGIWGRTVRRRPERVTTDIVAVPQDFVQMHKFLVLTAGVMFVNGIPFLLTRSRGLQLITVEFLPRRMAKIIGAKLTHVLHLYHRAGFVVQTALMDKEFDALADQCPTLPINTTAANEHVPEIKRAIRLVKERARGIENTLPFTGLPKLMTIELIHFIVLWLNNFPVKSGVSTKYSPRELVYRHKLSAKVHCKTQFGAYCETAIQARIAADNAGLNNGDAPDQGPHLVEADPDEMGDDDSIIEIGEVPPTEPQGIVDIDYEDEPEQDPGADYGDQGADPIHGGELSDDEGADGEYHEGDESPESELLDHDESTGGLSDQGAAHQLGDEDEAEEGMPRRSRRNRKVSTRLEGFEHGIFTMYDREDAEAEVDEYMHATLSEDKCNEIDSYLVPVFGFIITKYSLKAGLKKAKGKDRKAIRKMMHDHLMMQYSLKTGLKMFSEDGEKAVSKELGQFHDLNVFIPVDPTKLTRQETAAALAALMLLKQKMDGTLKARACTDRRKQRESTAEEEAASPTVSIESIFISCAIEASEGRCVTIIDLPGAFLHADCEDHVIMRFHGRLAELMVLAAPQIYRKYVTTDANGEPVLFVKLQKGLYGMLKSALLFYKKLLTDLVAKGFTVNPYDPCVVTKMIRGKQMTICWHVDDLKISHKRKVEVKKLESWLRSIYGNISVSEGNKHTYLGMDLDYSEAGKCKITMSGYTKEVIDGFPEVIEGTAATPAADHLFQTREDGKKLPEEQAAAFHGTTAQLLFLSGRARRDIQTAVAFLTTQVKQPVEDDWGKLKRVLRYLNGTREMGLCLGVENMGLVRWYVDASYATHEDCKGHTGAMMTLGRGAAISLSRKQKTNARSSTEVELIGVYDALPSILHTKYFIEAMGYDIKNNVVYQDNKSSITLEHNGKASGLKRSKHIKIRYFSIKDVIDQGEVEVQHCPTTEMCPSKEKNSC
eukprot:CCRYP_000147-RA/>CCRYP_000147-RA protein AED:0.12 eAED:0.13 QI:0/0/0/1/0/0/3/0/1214